MDRPPKRIRSCNFTQKEKDVLLRAINKFKTIVENKNLGSATWRDKERAWLKITEEFNALCPNNTYRSTGSLKKVYDNNKWKTRKIERQKLHETVDEVPQPISKSNELILDIINNKSIIDSQNGFDSGLLEDSSDNIFLHTVVDIKGEENMTTLQEEDNINVSDRNGPSNGWGNYKPSNPKVPIQQNLYQECKKCNERIASSQRTDKDGKLAELKIELINMQIESLKKENALKTELLQLEIEIKKQELNMLKKKSNFVNNTNTF